MNAALRSMPISVAFGPSLRRISPVIAPVPTPSSTITRAFEKSMGRRSADARERELGNRDAVAPKDRSDCVKNKTSLLLERTPNGLRFGKNLGCERLGKVMFKKSLLSFAAS